MARLEFRKPHGIDLMRRMTYRTARRMYGRVLEPVQVLAHHTPLMIGYGAIGLSHERYSRSIGQRLKSLAMLRTAQLVGCEWCLDFGSKLAVDGGVPEDDLRELSLWRSSARFDAVDKLVLEYAEAMTRTPSAVTDELFAQLREHFDEKQMVELTMTIALENMYSRSNWAFGIEGAGFSEGTYCVRPEAPGAAVPVPAAAG
jgi:AhpD family alkylhydroperoxidase